MDSNVEDSSCKSGFLDETACKFQTEFHGYFSSILSTPGVPPRTGFSLKEQEEELNALKKENFNLKLRIYFAEERQEQMKSIKSIEDALQKITDLNVELETLRKELDEKDKLLVETAKGMDLLQNLYQSESESLQKLSMEKEKLETQNEALKRELEELKSRLGVTADHLSTSGHSSLPTHDEKIKKKVNSSGASERSRTEKSPKKNGSLSGRKEHETSSNSIIALEEQLKKVLVENSKAMEAIQYLLQTNKLLRQKLSNYERKSGSINVAASKEDQNQEVKLNQGKLVEELETEVKRLASEVEEKRTNSQELKQEVKKWMSNFKEKECELREISKFIEEKNRKILELEQELKESELKLQLSENVKDLQEDSFNPKEKQELKWMLSEKEKENEILKTELRKRTYNLQELVNKELWNKNREIEKLNKVCERRLIDLNSLKQQIKSNDFERILLEKCNDPRYCNTTSSIVKKTTHNITVNQNMCSEEFKENSEPVTRIEASTKFLMNQLETALEEKKKLIETVKELQEKIAGYESNKQLIESLRTQYSEAKADAEMAEKMLKDSVNACTLLTTRLEELAGFLDSLLTEEHFPILSEEKKKELKDAVEQSRQLSKSLSLSLNIDNITDLSMKCSSAEPILPDYSEINFSSEEDNVAEVMLEQLPTTETEKVLAEDRDNLKLLHSEVVSLTEKLKSADLGLRDSSCKIDFEPDSELNPQKSCFFERSNEPSVQNEGSCSVPKIDPMYLLNRKSSKFRDKTYASCTNLRRFCRNLNQENLNFYDYSKDFNGGASSHSDSESWSEPDRNASLARIGLSKESIALSKPYSETETSDFEEINSTRVSGKKSKKIYEKSIKQKLHLVEEMNLSLRQEVQNLHSILASVSNKVGDEDVMNQLRSLNNQLSESHHKCAELEKQLSTANTRCHTLLNLLDKADKKSSELNEAETCIKKLEQNCHDLNLKLQESNSQLSSMKSIKEQYDITVNELERTKKEMSKVSETLISELGTSKKQHELLQAELEKERDSHALTRENLAKLKEEIRRIQVLLQERTECILEKECALLETQNKLKESTIEFELRMKESEERCIMSEKRVKEVENGLTEAVEKLKSAENKVSNLTSQLKGLENEYCLVRSSLEKQVSDYENLKSHCEREVLNLKLQLENFKAEEEQNAECHKKVLNEMSKQIESLKLERQEALKLVEEWQRKVDQLVEEKEKIILSRTEQEKKNAAKADKIARETEAGLRYQLQAASTQCAHAESHARNIEKQYKLRERELKSWYNERETELRRQLDNATLTTSEVVLERTRLANDKLRLQQELRNRHKNSQYEQELERVKRELERRVAELEAANGEMETKLANIYVSKEQFSDCENTSVCDESLLSSPVQITPLNIDTTDDVSGSPKLWMKGDYSPGLKTCISTLSYHNHVYLRQRSNENSSDYVSDQELAIPLQTLNEKSGGVGTCSPDLGIESDQGRTSSSEQVTLCKSKTNDFQKLEEENVTLRNKLFRTKQALEETLTQLSSANKKKRQVENAICKQLHKTHHILKQARVNLELRSEIGAQESNEEKN